MASQRIRTGTVAVHGLPELSRALRSIDADLVKELRDTNKEVANDVKDGAQAKAYSLGGVAAHVASSLSANAGQQSAAVAGGGTAHPAFGGAEFGGQGRPTTQQFKPWRGSGEGAGYFLYPTIRDKAPQIEDAYLRGLEQLLRKVDLIA